MSIERAVQQTAPGDFVQLFRLDCTAIGASIYHFVLGRLELSPVQWQGQTYVPMDIEAEGFEWSGRGPLPTPTLRIGKNNSVIQALINDYQDLLGARLTRTRTFRQFLDGQDQADPTAHLETDIYQIERKVSSNKVFVEFELASVLDQQGRMLPGRVVLRDNCSHRYRRWNGTAFDYTQATCPYAGANYFDKVGSPTTQANDTCGKRLSDCKARFGANNPLPFRGFPGVARIRG